MLLKVDALLNRIFNGTASRRPRLRKYHTPACEALESRALLSADTVVVSAVVCENCDTSVQSEHAELHEAAHVEELHTHDGIIDVGDLPGGIIDIGDLPDGLKIIDIGDLPDGIIDVGDLPGGIIDVGDLPDGLKIIDIGDLPGGIIDVGDLPGGIIDVGDLPDGVVESANSASGIIDIGDLPDGILSL